MNRERMQNLLRVIEDQKAKGKPIYMSRWRISKYDEGLKQFPNWLIELVNECGTVCCAAGLACQDAWFIADGLTLLPTRHAICGQQSDHVMPGYKSKIGYDALEEYFDLSYEHVRYIFSDISYLSNSNIDTVICHIKTVIDFQKIEDQIK